MMSPPNRHFLKRLLSSMSDRRSSSNGGGSGFATRRCRKRRSSALTTSASTVEAPKGSQSSDRASFGESSEESASTMTIAAVPHDAAAVVPQVNAARAQHDVLVPAKVAAFNNLGQAHHSQGRRDVALRYYARGRELALRNAEGGTRRRCVIIPVLPTLLHNMGLIYMDFRRSEDALAYFRESLEARRRSEARRQCHRRRARSDSNEYWYEPPRNERSDDEPQQRQSDDDEHDTDIHASTLHGMGLAYLDLGRPHAALEALAQSLRLRRGANNAGNADPRDLADTLETVAHIQAELGRHDEALESHAEILRLQVDAKELAATLCHIGRLRHLRMELGEALHAYQEAWRLMSLAAVSAASSGGGSSNAGTAGSNSSPYRIADLVGVLSAMTAVHLERGDVERAELCAAEQMRIQGIADNDKSAAGEISSSAAAAAAGRDVLARWGFMSSPAA